MTDRFMTVCEVAARYAVNRTTIFRWLKVDPSFPRSVNLSPGCTRWRLSDLERWETARAGRPHETSRTGAAA